MLQALEGIPVERADWILWLDMDLLVDNMNFTFPIDKYAGKDMILHGDEDWIKKGDARRGALKSQPYKWQLTCVSELKESKASCAVQA